MTMVGGPDPGLRAAMLQFLQNRKAVKREQAAKFLQALQPGEALGEKGAKAFKTATGQEADPTKVLTPTTFQQEWDKLMKNVMTNPKVLPPGLVETLGKNAFFNAATGETGPQSEKSYASRLGEIENVTGIRERATGVAAEEAKTGIAPTTEMGKRLSAAGQRHTFGETTTETETSEQVAAARSELIPTDVAVGKAEGEAKVAEAETKKAQALVVQTIMADPNNSALGKLYKSRGKDPQAIMEAFAMGQGSLITGFMSEDLAKLQARLEKEGRSGELANEMAKMKFKAAGEQAPVMGITPEAYLRLEDAIDTGRDLYSVGVSPEDVELYQGGKKLQTAAFMRTQAAKEDPDARYLEATLDNFKNAKDPQQLNTMQEIAEQVTATIQTRAEMKAERPGADNPAAQELWDRQYRKNHRTLVLGNVDIRSFRPDKYQIVQQSGPLQGHPIEETGPGATPRDATKQPTFKDPSASKAVSGAVRMLNDTSLFKFPAGSVKNVNKGNKLPGQP